MNKNKELIEKSKESSTSDDIKFGTALELLLSGIGSVLDVFGATGPSIKSITKYYGGGNALDEQAISGDFNTVSGDLYKAIDTHVYNMHLIRPEEPNIHSASYRIQSINVPVDLDHQILNHKVFYSCNLGPTKLKKKAITKKRLENYGN